MEVIKTDIEGVVIIEPKIFGDSRGYFYESYSQRDFEEKVSKVTFVQDNQSFSHYGVLRGLHFQNPPYTQSKLVRVIQGKVVDVAVDIRKGSPTFGKYVAVELTGENHKQFFIPKNFAHGFVVLSETAEFAYKNLLFSAENKEGWYGKLYDDGNYSAWNSADATHYPNQHAVLCGVDYEKLSFSSFLGARAKLDLCGERLHLGLGIAASPYTYVKAEDKHYKDLERKEFEFYTDFIHVFFKTFKGNFSTFFDINDILSLGLTGEALVSIPSRGIMNQYDRASSSWKNYEDTGGGASEYNFQIGLGIRVNLF